MSLQGDCLSLTGDLKKAVRMAADAVLIAVGTPTRRHNYSYIYSAPRGGRSSGLARLDGVKTLHFNDLSVAHTTGSSNFISASHEYFAVTQLLFDNAKNRSSAPYKN